MLGGAARGCVPPPGSASGSRSPRGRDPLPLDPEVPFRGLTRCAAVPVLARPPARPSHGGCDRPEPAVRVQGGECGPAGPWASRASPAPYRALSGVVNPAGAFKPSLGLWWPRVSPRKWPA